MLLRPKGGNRVLKFLRNDKRFIRFDVAKEYAFSVRCKRKKGYPIQRFIKLNSGWSGVVGTFLKKAITLFIGVQGTAYTYPIKDGTIDKDYSGDLLTLDTVLKGAWGEEFYNKIPEENREAILNGKVNVTVDVGSDPDLTELKLKHMSAEDLKIEEDKSASETFWEGREETKKGAWIQWMFIFGSGIAAALILQIIGILKI